MANVIRIAEPKVAKSDRGFLEAGALVRFGGTGLAQDLGKPRRKRHRIGLGGASSSARCRAWRASRFSKNRRQFAFEQGGLGGLRKRSAPSPLEVQREQQFYDIGPAARIDPGRKAVDAAFFPSTFEGGEELSELVAARMEEHLLPAMLSKSRPSKDLAPLRVRALSFSEGPSELHPAPHFWPGRGTLRRRSARQCLEAARDSDHDSRRSTCEEPRPPQRPFFRISESTPSSRWPLAFSHRLNCPTESPSGRIRSDA